MTTERKTSAAPEVVIREFPPIGKYRIRVVQQNKSKDQVLDIREYVSGTSFEGFTRRGIRIEVNNRAGLDLLREIINELLEAKKA